MGIKANNIIQDALALIDVVAPGEAADKWWSELAVRMLNGMLGEWSQKGYYNPGQSFSTLASTTTKDFFTLGTDDSLKTLSEDTYSIVATLDPAGAYYRYLNVVDGKTYTKYSITGSGSTYSLVLTLDNSGTFYSINGGYAEKLVGDIPENYSTLQAVQVDLGTVVYNPTRISLAEYQALSIKQNQSMPQYYAWDFQQPVSKLYFWPKLLPNCKLRVVGQPTISTITNTQSTIEIDEIYYSALLFNLATKLYPFLKRDNGIDQELIYNAKASLTALRSKVRVMTAKRQVVPFGGSTPAMEYWTGPLNTVNGGM